MTIKLFNNEITIRDKYCNFFCNEGSDIIETYINLYVRFKGCNANCLFCEYKEIGNSFNFKKYENVLNEIRNNNIELRKISFTGGEPTLNYNRFKDILKYTREKLPETYVSVNTNGLHLIDMFYDSTIDNLDNVALSRHHHIDKINNKLLGFKSISNSQISEIQNTHNRTELMHFSCNLVKHGIDTNKKVINFLENANKLNVYSAGFSSLMPANQFCKENFVDINILELKKSFFNSKQFDDPGHCMCRNYLYTPKNFNGEHVKIYLKNTYGIQKTTNNFIFDGQNLRYGFGQDNIIY